MNITKYCNVMNIIQLPAILPGNLDLAAINEQLKNRAAQLDWSSVISVNEQHLAVLLKGLSLDDSDVIDLENPTMSDNIAQKVVHYFNTHPNIENNNHQNSENKHPSILETPSYYQIRAELEQAILDDLLGPAGGDYEEIDEMRVSDRYLVGLIAPSDRHIIPEELEETPEQMDELAISGSGTLEEGTTESNILPAEKMFPSAIGMTFCVDGNAKAIKVKAGWGQYEKGKSESAQTSTGEAKTLWRRYPIRGTSPDIILKVGAINPWQIDPEKAVFVQGQIRQQHQDWIVTLFLVNGQKEPEIRRDSAWLFQPELSVESADPKYPEIFIKRRLKRQLGKLNPVLFAEEQAMAMQYRDCIEFAVGHGTGVHAELLGGKCDGEASQKHRAIRLATKVVPAYEIPQTTPPTIEEIPGLAGLILDMKELAEIPDLSTALSSLTIAYSEWITQQNAKVADSTADLEDYQEAAKSALENCQITCDRIQAGITLLQTDSQAAEAFQFMNVAMWKQRIHSIYAENKRRGEASEWDNIDIPKNRTWRPFQLAFILLNLPSITELDHPDRCHPTDAIADLLWLGASHFCRYIK